MLPDGFRDAIAFVAHDDDALGRERLTVDVLAVEQGAVDRVGRRQGVQEIGEARVVNIHMGDTPHRGLHDLGIVGVGAVFATVDGVDAEPVGNADDGAEVAGILHAVEHQGECVCLRC